ncbi:GntR family transcriptional regulator [Siccirubricoccus deserti]|uniref:GntR family transcriptional regulator n=1 Tax=Siccirubricoccus deserti TaxID=2013562 RepID=A0A9X0QYT1_9PROT|nr:GntR family transcriptional regulator [Siccirubricoccus deserti]MBC4016110.1 GntR family transcriptional regulator [Siccirubricoccus deserti]GGC46013.1 GntR family transcriptional regulator [Siccirubricoccus deserti]
MHPPAADELIGRTLASDVLHRLRADIVEVRLPPGQRLRFETLRTAYGVSFSTLREALAHLVQEGLVAAEGQRGFRVAGISCGEYEDLIRARILIEREVLRLAVQHADPAWDDRLTARFDTIGDSGDIRCMPGSEWLARHRGFIDTLVAPCGSPTLLTMRAVLARRALRYGFWAGEMHPGLAPHRPLLEAALARDAAALMDERTAQIRRIGEDILRHLGDHLIAG